MLKRRMIGLVLSLAMTLSLFAGITIVSATPDDTVSNDEGMVELAEYTAYKTFNFKSASVDGAINVSKDELYDKAKGYGFVKTNNAMPARTVDTTRIVQDENGCNITETSATTEYDKDNTNHYNFGGIIFRVDLEAIGGYGLTVKTTSTNSETAVAPNGMQASRLTGTSAWDSAGLVARKSSATWTDSNTWKYDLVTGVNYIEIEVEPLKKEGGTVGIESFEITKFGNNQASDKPTVFVLGDSTQKTYVFEEDGMSGWGQIINKMFDLDKVNVVNYSMGGRSFKSSHDEGRFNEVLYTAKEGDYLLIHSAHNDESTGPNAGPEARFGRGSNSTTYPKWLDMYCAALEERGVTPVLVTPMPRTNRGVSGSGFNPDSPSFMRAKAASDSKVELVELYNNSKAYLKEIGTEETIYIYLSLEAGESPGKTNGGSYANGHPDSKIDGTHYKEAAAKIWSKIIAEQIYDQGVTKVASASEKMKELSNYLNDTVKTACSSNDWSSVFPEWAKDVTEAKINGYPEKNAYYRNQIEKMLEMGIMFKDPNGLFNPETSINTNDFISALCSIWNLETDSFSSYFTSLALNRETMSSIIYDAYELKFGKADDGSWNKPKYMTDYNGKNLSPDDPNYDPNLIGKSSQYYPIVVWDNLTDTPTISKEHVGKFYEVYNLGLMRSEKGLARDKMMNGTQLEPKVQVTRAKAAKELYFLFGLVQNIKTENQEMTVPTVYGGTDKNPVVYKAITYSAKDYEFSAVDINNYGELSVSLVYNQSGTPTNKLVVEVYNADKTLVDTKKYDVAGTGKVSGLDVTLTGGQYVTMYVIQSETDTTKLSNDRVAEFTDVIIPAKKYTAKTEAGIENGTLALTNNSVQTENALSLAEVDLAADSTVWWKATKSIVGGDELMPGLTAQTDLSFTKGSNTIAGESFNGYVSHSTVNGKYENGTLTGTAFKFVAPSDGVMTVYTTNLGENKKFLIIKEGATGEADYLAQSFGVGGNISISAPVEKGQTYYTAVTGSKGRFTGISFSYGAPIVSVKATTGDEVQVDATPEEGYRTESITAVDSNNKSINLVSKSDDCSTFVMPESDVTVNATFVEVGKETPPPLFVGAYTINDISFVDEKTVSADYTCEDEAYTDAKMLIATYNKADESIMTDLKIVDINGTEVKEFEYATPDGDSVVKAYIWSGVDTLVPLSLDVEVKPYVIPSTKQVTLTQVSSGTEEIYTTVNDALKKAVELNPSSEDERVVLAITPGLYREQLFIDTPYITLKKDDSAQYKNVEASYGVGNENTNESGGYLPDSEKEVVITWYYGTGYQYKSVGSDGRYDANLAAGTDNTVSGHNIEQWGPVLRIDKNAKNFVADDIVIENSFNRYLTQEELDDCVAPGPGEKAPARTAGTIVTTRGANERAAAVVCKADFATFIGCKMLGTQDTMGMGSGREYYENCYFEGRTDYLCDGATVVFNECDLMFYGYSDTNDGCTLIAPQDPSNGKYGYLFYKCFIGKTKNSMKPCTLGRPWKNGAQATYYMCTIEDENTIVTNGNAWSSMDNKDPKENANFIEFGSVYPNGTNAIPPKTSTNDRMDYVVDEWEILEYNPRNYLRSNIDEFPGDWDPMDFAKNYLNVDAEVAVAEVNVNTAIEQTSGNTITLPDASNGFEYKWISSSPNATVNGNSIEIIRPASGMEPIQASIVLYVKESGTEFGDRVEVPLTITPTNDTENVFTLSGKVIIPEAFSTDVNYLVELRTNGALVKTENATIPAGQTSGTYSALNIPYGTYDVKVSVDNAELQIATPDRGTTTVTGTNDDKAKDLDIVIGKLVSKSVKVTTDPSMTAGDSKLSFTNNAGEYTFKTSGDTANGYYWNLIDSIDESERDAVANAKTMTVTYSLSPIAAAKANLKESYIDLKSGSSIPGEYKASTDTSRFNRLKMNASWEQLDMIDGSVAGYGGTSNTENQQLNLSGKWIYGSTSTATIKNTISFENSITNVLGTGENTNSGGNKDMEVSFGAFPTDVNMSNLFLVIYPNKSGANITISELYIEYQVLELAE